MSWHSLKFDKILIIAILATLLLCLCSCTPANIASFISHYILPSPSLENSIPDETVSMITEDDLDLETHSESETVPTYEEDRAAEWINWYDSRWGEGSSDNIIMTSEEIISANKRIINECESVIDIVAPPTEMSGNQIKTKIESYVFPQIQLADSNGVLLDESQRNSILDNRGLTLISDTVSVKTAIITTRCNLKSFPTELNLFEPPDTKYSSIQETELIVSAPIWVLYTSSDNRFLFVQAYNYFGWISADAAAFCSIDEFHQFADRTKYITVISPVCHIENTRLDMGATFPVIDENADSFRFLLPKRSDEGNLILCESDISKSDAVMGSLPYTVSNFYKQAFAYLGTPYGWGGSDGGVDCSGFVCSVLRTVGLYLPRNSGDQALFNGTVTDINGLSAEEKNSIFKDIKFPATLHRKGHVMILLGVRDNTCYIIHAPGGSYVTETAFYDFDKLTAVDVLNK